VAWQDIRGRDVYAAEGDQIGTVKELYVDTGERKVRFLTFESGASWAHRSAGRTA